MEEHQHEAEGTAMEEKPLILEAENRSARKLRSTEITESTIARHGRTAESTVVGT